MSIIVKTIPEGWNIITLENTEIEIIDGDRGKNYPKKSELLKQGYCPFFNNKNIIGDKISLEEVDFISEDKDRQLRKGKAFLDDIIITTRGSVGNVGILHEGLGITFARINSGMVILRNKDSNINTWYLYYLLKSPLVKEQYRILSSGSAQPQLPIRDLKKIELVIPPYDLQVKVASILDSYERKIELNNQMNETLEEMAMTLYKHWFVDFGPFQDGEFVESELGMIPKGWQVVKVGNLGEVITGKTPSTKIPENYGDDIPFIKIPDMHNQVYAVTTETRLSLKGADSQKNKYLPKDTVCVSCIATPGLVCLTDQESQTNQQINSIICNESVSPFFTYLFFRHISNDIISLGSGGTATHNLNKGDFSNIKLILPEERIMTQFHENIISLFKQIRSNQHEIENLSRIRDYLLPKLLSGEIDLSNTEKEVEKVL